MTDWTAFVRSQLGGGAKAVEDAERPPVAAYGDPVEEYYAISVGPALVDRSYRALLQVTGADRATWLHNLTTNRVKTLGLGDGSYAFALNLHGRILFDLNVLVRQDSIWVDLDRRFLARALQHFDKYRVIENVSVVDRSDAFVRLALAGSGAVEFLEEVGAPHAVGLPALGTAEISWGGVSITLIRHDFCGPFSVELYLPPDRAAEFWQTLADPSRQLVATAAGDEAVQMHRIEAGIPWPGRELTDEYLPAETGQLQLAVSFNKGCYLGQEVVERMRSRNVVARRLIGLQIEGDILPPAGAAILNQDESAIGSVTSVCRSPAKHAIIGMGYVKTASSSVGTALRVSWNGQTAGALVASLPFTSGASL